ncbi:MAG: hypothetical protein LBQ88_08700 [Treponema sp.]|jgi:hypothetical protein|nr:hypothetical protein [Treponema sp.]
MQKIGVAIGLDVSDLVSNAQTAKGALESMGRTLDSSIKKGNLEDVKNYAQASIAARNNFIKDARIGGYSDKVTLDAAPLQEHIKNLGSAMKQMIAEGRSREAKEYSAIINDFQKQFTHEQADRGNNGFENNIRQAINAGDTDTVQSQLAMRKQFIEDARIGGDSDIKLDSGPLENVIKDLTAAMNRAISEGNRDKAKEYQSVLGKFQKQIELEQGDDGREKKLAQNRQARLIRDFTRITSAQNVIGQAGAGNVAGAALGAAGGIGDLVSQIPKAGLIGTAVVGAITAVVAGANKLSEQWEKVMQPSMALAASLGRLSDDADKNHAAFQEVFAQATDRNVLHGYSLEEGLDLANQLSKSGMAADNVIGGEEQVFRYQRLTDADRGDLSRAVGYAGRYRNNENVLGYVYGGVKESGMQQGQYQEYLNATLRIFEEGIYKGVIKGFAEITRTQNMLAQIGETWKGEQGAQRILQMEDAVTGAGKLKSDYDFIMYRAAQKQIEEEGGEASHLNVSKRLEQGISGNPEILGYVHEIMKGMAGDDRGTGIMMYENAFGLKATAAEQLWDALEEGLKGRDKAAAVFEDPDAKAVDDTPEAKLLSATQGIRQDLANLGENVIGAKAGIVDAISKLTHIMAGDKIFTYYDKEVDKSLDNIGPAGDIREKLSGLLHEAYKNKDQPDADLNRMGDYAESAAEFQRLINNMPADKQAKIAMTPHLQRATAVRFN